MHTAGSRNRQAAGGACKLRSAISLAAAGKGAWRIDQPKRALASSSAVAPSSTKMLGELMSQQRGRRMEREAPIADDAGGDALDGLFGPLRLTQHDQGVVAVGVHEVPQKTAIIRLDA